MTKNLNELYFIRLSDNKENFVHVKVPFVQCPDYIVKKGLKGACMFDKKNAELFIEISESYNLEMVKASELLTN